MKILQISTTQGQNCGIAFFADNLHKQIEKLGIEIKTVTTLNNDTSVVDVTLLQYHSELLDEKIIISMRKKSQCPVVLFTHSDGISMLTDKVDGFVAMCPGMLPEAAQPSYIFPHPAWVPKCLEDRTNLREYFGLPSDRMIIGTNGFLKFDRQFPEILSKLLPHAKQKGWFVDLITSSWYRESPGLDFNLEKLQSNYPNNFRFGKSFLDVKTLNQRLQACDILWCWTMEPSIPYASGVISDQYASGTRIFATNKIQHHHVLELPNVVKASDQLTSFIEQMILEIKDGRNSRHDPTPISWDRYIHGLILFLAKIHSREGETLSHPECVTMARRHSEEEGHGTDG